MANCELGLVPLTCDRTGTGFTAHPLDIESNRLHLVKGHAKHFPPIINGQYFYVRIKGCDGCCEVAKVVGIDEDVFELDRTMSAKCACIKSNTMVTYEWDTIQVIKDIANSIGINVESPLKYDACTRTLSVDCKELFAKDCGGCGEGVPNGGNAVAPAGGLRGEQGEKGEAGVGLASFTITASGQLMYTLTDGTTRSAGVLPVAKGARGEQGPRGEPGVQGDKGDDGKYPTTVNIADGKIRFVMSDNSVLETDASTLKGEKGDKGDAGPKGDKGDVGYSFQYVETEDKAYVFGVPNIAFTIQSPAMPNVTLGPYTTAADGFVEIPKPPTSGKAVLKLMVKDAIVGIGRTG